MLFNAKLYNTGLYNGGSALAEVYSSDTLVFDGFSLSDGSTMVLTRLKISGPSKELVGGPVPRGHGQYLTADYSRSYVIEAEGIVQASTAALLDAQLDVIRKNLRKRERNLDYTDANGTVKRFVATLVNPDQMLAGREHYHITFHPWKAVFECRTPFATSRSYSSISQAVTVSPTNLAEYNTGTARALPVVSLIFDAASSVTAASVSNTDTGEEITYTGSLVANDILVFNSEDKRVKLNGTEVNYTGGFLTLEPGANLLQFTITGSSFDCYVTVSHRTTYL